jgi:hypothetical protein
MAAILWRVGEHPGEMRLQQGADFRAGQIVFYDAKCRHGDRPYFQ